MKQFLSSFVCHFHVMLLYTHDILPLRIASSHFRMLFPIITFTNVLGLKNIGIKYTKHNIKVNPQQEIHCRKEHLVAEVFFTHTHVHTHKQTHTYIHTNQQKTKLHIHLVQQLAVLKMKSVGRLQIPVYFVSLCVNAIEKAMTSSVCYGLHS